MEVGKKNRSAKIVAVLTLLMLALQYFSMTASAALWPPNVLVRNVMYNKKSHTFYWNAPTETKNLYRYDIYIMDAKKKLLWGPRVEAKDAKGKIKKSLSLKVGDKEYKRIGNEMRFVRIDCVYSRPGDVIPPQPITGVVYKIK
jgi:hypothetical protein